MRLRLSPHQASRLVITGRGLFFAFALLLLALPPLLCAAPGGALAADRLLPDGSTDTTPWVLDAGPNTVTVDGTGSGAISGNISGASGGLVKAGTGTLVLSGANSHGGGTTLSGGTITIGSDTALGRWTAGPATANAGKVTASGEATLNIIDNRTITNRFEVSTTGSLNFDIATGKTLTITGVENTSAFGSGGDYGGAIQVLRPSDGTARYLTFNKGGAPQGHLVFSNNKAVYGGAVGSYFNEAATRSVLDFGGLSSIVFSGNSATRDGGGIYSYYSSSVTLGDHATFTGNYAGTANARGFGGAIYTLGGLTLAGKTLFQNNFAKTNAGAVYLGGTNTPYTATLVATVDALTSPKAGDILFRGNKSGVTFTAGVPSGGVANSLYLAYNTNLKLSGLGNIYFDDPISSGNLGQNSLQMSGPGMAQFMGTNGLNATGFNETTPPARKALSVVGDGTDNPTVRLAGPGAAFTVTGGNAEFNKASLAGAGSLILNPATGMVSLTDVTIAPDGYTYSPTAALDGTTMLSGANGAIGTLNVTGNVTLAGANTFKIELSNPGDVASAGTSDKLSVTGTITDASSTLNLDLQNPLTGKYTVLTSTASLPGTLVPTITVGGVAWDDARVRKNRLSQLDASLAASTPTSLILTVTGARNKVLTWTGDADDVWDNNTTINWNAAAVAECFLDGDQVLFDSAEIQNPETIAGHRNVSDMAVSGDNSYTFNGAGAAGNDSLTIDNVRTTLLSSTGRLTVEGSYSGDLIFNVPVIALGSGTPNIAVELKAGTGTVDFAKGYTGGRIISETSSNLTLKGTVSIAGQSTTGSGGGIDWKGSGRIDLGDGVNFSNNTAGTGGGGIDSSSSSSSVTLGDYATFTGNTAGTDGGGIYSISFSSSSSVTLGEGAIFKDNRAGTVGGVGQGGAVFSSHDLTLAGNSAFLNNFAGANSGGGAIFLNGSGATNTASLRAETGTAGSGQAGHILFRGNKQGVTFTAGLPNPSTGTPNSLYLNQKTALALSGPGNIYFDDPISSGTTGGNSLSKSGSGFVQFMGNSLLNPTGKPGGGVTVSDGEFRVAQGANFATQGDDAVFTVQTGGALAGGGTIVAEQGFSITGTLTPDAFTHTISDDLRTFSTAIPASQAIGILTLAGDTTFNGATLAVDLEAANASDRVRVTGDVTLANSNTVRLGNWQTGTFSLLTATGTINGTVAANFRAVTGNPAASSLPPLHGKAELYITGGNTLQLLNSDTGNNVAITWTGASSDQWDTSAVNWKGTSFFGAPATGAFLPGDRIILDSTDSTGRRTITLPSGGATVADIMVSGNGDYVLNGSIAAITNPVMTTLTDATGSLTKNGSGTLTLNGNNSFAGHVFVNDGVLSVSATTNLGAAGDVLNLDNNGVLLVTANMGNNHAVVLGAGGGVINIAASAGMTQMREISGSGGLTKTGDGTLILTGANTYSGGTSVTGGDLVATSDGSLGALSGGLELNGGALQNENTFSSARAVTLGANGGAFNTPANTPLTLTGVISGSGSLTKTRDGTLILTGANTYSGDTNINGGTLSVSNNGNLGAASGLLALNGGALRTTGTFASARNIYLGPNGGAFDTDALTTLSLSGTIGGAAGRPTPDGLLTKKGAGTLVLDGNYSMGHGLTLDGGTLKVASGKTLDIDGGLDIWGSSTLGLTAGAVTPVTTDSMTIASGAILDISGYAPASPLGTSYTLLTSTAQINGTFGTVTVGGITPFPQTPSLDRFLDVAVDQTANNGHAITISTDLVWNKATNAHGAFNIASGQTFDLGANLADNTQTGAGTHFNWDGKSLTKTGPGTLTLSGNNTYSGTTTVSAGTLAGGIARDTDLIIANGATYQSSGDRDINTLTGDGHLDMGGAKVSVKSGNFSGVISGTGGSLRKENSGTLTLSGVNSYGGDTIIAGGILAVSSDANLGGAGAGIIFEGGRLTTTADVISSRSVTTSVASATFDTAAGTTLTLNGVISGNDSLTKIGAGTLVLSGTNTYGGTMIENGTLSVSADPNLGNSTGPLLLNGGTLAVTDSFTSARDVGTGINNGSIDTASGKKLTLTGLLSGGGRLTKTGSGTLALNRDATLSNGLTLAGGTLGVASGKTLDVAGGLDIRTGATLGLAVGIMPTVTTDNLTIGSGTTLDITGYGAGVSLDSGTVHTLLRSANAINGRFSSVLLAGAPISPNPSLDSFLDIVVNQAANRGKAITISSGPVWNKDVNAHGTFNIAGGQSFSLGADLADNTQAGAGTYFNWDQKSLTKTGTGTLLLIGKSTYTGATTINNGALLVGDAAHTDARVSGNVAVNNTGLLGGTGNVGGSVIVNNGGRVGGQGLTTGNVTVNSGGILSAGYGEAGDAVGTLTTGSLTLRSGSRSIFDLGATSDQVNVKGNLTLGGALQGLASAAGSYTLFDYTGALSGSFGSESVTGISGFVLGDYNLDTGTAGKITLNVLAPGQSSLQFWNGAVTRADGTVHGGSGTWSASASHQLDQHHRARQRTLGRVRGRVCRNSRHGHGQRHPALRHPAVFNRRLRPDRRSPGAGPGHGRHRRDQRGRQCHGHRQLRNQQHVRSHPHCSCNHEP